MITKTPNVCGGSARIENTRITVRTIVQYTQLGLSPEEIAGPDMYPHLSIENVKEALEYYSNNKNEIDREIVFDKDNDNYCDGCGVMFSYVNDSQDWIGLVLCNTCRKVIDMTPEELEAFKRLPEGKKYGEERKDE